MPGVTSIGDYAFANTGLTLFTMPTNLIYIGKHAFENNQIATIINNLKIETIDDYAFYNCSLTEINIPNSLKVLGEAVFVKA